MKIRRFQPQDTETATEIWNSIVEDGIAFPQMNIIEGEEARLFFEGQSYTGVAEDEETGQILGLYILHPNNVGRCGHICNTSYAVKKGIRGRHIGEQLVKDSMAMNIANSFGAGMGNMEGTCGALVGAGLVLGLVNKDKARSMKQMRQIMTKFQERNEATQCKLLKGVGTKVALRECPDCVADAAEFMEEVLNQE